MQHGVFGYGGSNGVIFVAWPHGDRKWPLIWLNARICGCSASN